MIELFSEVFLALLFTSVVFLLAGLHLAQWKEKKSSHSTPFLGEEPAFPIPHTEVRTKEVTNEINLLTEIEDLKARLEGVTERQKEHQNRIEIQNKNYENQVGQLQMDQVETEGIIKDIKSVIENTHEALSEVKNSETKVINNSNRLYNLEKDLARLRKNHYFY